VERSSILYTQLILAYGASIFVKTWDGETPLMSAVRARSIWAVRHLLNHCEALANDRLKGYLEEKNVQGDTALSLAIKTRQGQAMSALLSYLAERPAAPILLNQMCEAHTEINFLGNYVLSRKARGELSQEDIDKAYYVACKHGHFIAQFALSTHGERPREFVDEQGWTVVHFYAMHGNVDAMDDFLKMNPEDVLRMTKDGFSLAAIAAKHGKTEVLKKLVAAMVERNIPFDKQYQGKHLVVAAMESRDIETLDAVCFYMSTSNVVLDEQGRTPAHFAAMWGDVEMLDLFRRRNGNFVVTDAFGKTPLHYALEYGWDEVVEFLLNPAFEIPFPQNWFTSLTNTTTPEIIQKLLRVADCNAQDSLTGETALFKAVELDNFPVFMALLAHKADTTIQSKNGETPFLKAVALDRIQFIAMLYERAFLEETSEGRNGLHIAASLGNERSVRFLLSRGMDHSKKDHEGRTPLELAQTKGFTHIVEILSGKNDQLLERKRQLIGALRTGLKGEFLRLASTFPLNHSLLFDIDGRDVCVPILHLIYMLIPSEEIARDFSTAFLKLSGAKRDVVSPEGLTVDHILAAQGKDVDVESIDLGKKDIRGASLLHFLAAADATRSERVLAKVLDHVGTVDLEDSRGCTPLFAAIAGNNEEKVTLLLAKGANPNHLSKSRVSPLFLAVEKGLCTIANLLVRYGADVNQVCLETKQTPLHIATQQGNYGLVRFLVDAGADPNKRMMHGVVPIHLAARRGDINLLFNLMRSGADYFAVDDNGWSIAHHAALSEKPEIFHFLVGHSISLDDRARPKNGAKTPPNMIGVTPLHIAAQRGNVLAIRALLALGATSTIQTEINFSPLVFAGMSGNRKTVKCFVNQPVFKDAKQLFLATQIVTIRDAVSSLQLLCPTKKMLQCPVDGQTTIAHVAASHSSVKVLRYLLTEGVSLKEKDFKGRTPFEVAIESNSLTSARYLLLETDVVDFAEKTSVGLPYLHFVCQRQLPTMAQLLIEAGAPLNEEDYLHRTPLHHALTQKDERLVRLLLQSGAEIDLKAMRDLMPKEHPGIQDLMSEYARRRATESKAEPS
jgi:ankyrin repeat protein